MGIPHPSATRVLLLLACAGVVAATASAAPPVGQPMHMPHPQGAGIYGSRQPLGSIYGGDAPSHAPLVCSGPGEAADTGNLTHLTVCLAEGSDKGASHMGTVDPSYFASVLAELMSNQPPEWDCANGMPAGDPGLNSVDPEEGSEEGCLDYDEQWGFIVSGMEEYGAELADFARDLEQRATEWADQAQDWADCTIGTHPYSSRFNVSAKHPPRHTDDLSSYASAMSAFAGRLATSAADVEDQAGEFLSLVDSALAQDPSSDWSLLEDCKWCTTSLEGLLSHLASMTAELAAASASWHANVDFLSAQHLNNTGTAAILGSHSLFLAETAGDIDELALSWSSHATDMDTWVTDWRDYAFNTELIL